MNIFEWFGGLLDLLADPKKGESKTKYVLRSLRSIGLTFLLVVVAPVTVLIVILSGGFSYSTLMNISMWIGVIVGIAFIGVGIVVVINIITGILKSWAKKRK